MSNSLFQTTVVPIGDPDDAADTAQIIGKFIPKGGKILVAHVVEKGGGAPDKASLEQREQFAEDAYNTFVETLPDGDYSIEFLPLYGRDVAETIIQGAEEVDATAIAFVPRGGSRWIKFLTGDVALNLVENSSIPVISLPHKDAQLETSQHS
ncbi:universal stress protein [Halobellus limi]|uniref:Universal stress protein n=1 Tax=Halobellus limi TaxID=699433 RepID=A0A1H5VWE2_9EURY|nr:universal stress protein [Halobellus limi]QCC46598.1 universal stress protein [Halobellus limi]SEF91582.1 Nucleotide-binding universal stress protein, UspA family [Halobellus limi]